MVAFAILFFIKIYRKVRENQPLWTRLSWDSVVLIDKLQALRAASIKEGIDRERRGTGPSAIFGWLKLCLGRKNQETEDEEETGSRSVHSTLGDQEATEAHEMVALNTEEDSQARSAAQELSSCVRRPSGLSELGTHNQDRRPSELETTRSRSHSGYHDGRRSSQGTQPQG